jgi:outer membrane lipoprotein carrier protein
MVRIAAKGAWLLLPLLAACGGREKSADAPSGGIAVRTEGAHPVAVVPGGDTAAQPAAPAVDSAGGPSDVADPAPAAAPGRAAPSPRAPGGRQQDANEILRRVEQTASGIRTLEADFVQRLRVPLLNTDRTSSGRLYQRKPDRFAMRFSDPAGDLVVADGRHFWIYYPSSDRTQVVRTSIAEGGEQVDLQRQFLSNATERFVATLNGAETVDGQATWALTLVPRGNSPYKVIRVWVDQASFLVRRFEMTEDNDSVRRLELRNLRVNQPVADAVFSFTPPAGAQVYDQ